MLVANVPNLSFAGLFVAIFSGTFGILGLVFLLVGLGFSGAVVQMSLTGALRLAPVAVVIPMDYSALLWSIACGWWFFGTLPADTTWIGAPLIVASGLFIAWREHRRHIDRPKEVAA